MGDGGIKLFVGRMECAVPGRRCALFFFERTPFGRAAACDDKREPSPLKTLRAHTAHKGALSKTTTTTTKT
jgi:hypothetical protein